MRRCDNRRRVRGESYSLVEDSIVSSLRGVAAAVIAPISSVARVSMGPKTAHGTKGSDVVEVLLFGDSAAAIAVVSAVAIHKALTEVSPSMAESRMVGEGK